MDECSTRFPRLNSGASEGMKAIVFVRFAESIMNNENQFCWINQNFLCFFKLSDFVIEKITNKFSIGFINKLSQKSTFERWLTSGDIDIFESLGK